VHMLLEDDDSVDSKEARSRGLVALILVGLAVSVDELAIGFTLGLLGVSIVPVIVLIAIQAFVLSQVGLRIGARIAHHLAERAEKMAGIAVAVLATGLLVVELVG